MLYNKIKCNFRLVIHSISKEHMSYLIQGNAEKYFNLNYEIVV